MIYLLLAIAGSASMSIVLKIFHTQNGNRYGILLGNYLTCLLTAGVLLPDKGLIFHGSPITVAFGAVGGFFFVGGLVMMQSSIARNGATMTAAFARLGLIIPLLISIVFLGERPGLLSVLGIALAFAALIVIHTEPGGEKTSAAAGAPILLLLTLLMCGTSDGLAKLFERAGERSQDTLYFFYVFAMASLLTFALSVWEYRRTGKKIILRELLAGILVGIPNYFSSVLLLAALVRLPAFLVYPCFSTATILLVAVVSAFLFKEYPGRRQRAGLALILCALVLLNL